MKVATGQSNGPINIFETGTGKLVGVFEQSAKQIGFSPNGEALIAGDSRGFSVYDMQTFEETRRVDLGNIYQFSITAGAISGDGTVAIGFVSDGTLRVWNLTNGSEKSFPFVGPAVSAAMETSGETIAVGTNNGHIILLSSSDAHVVRDISAHSGAVNTLSFQGATLASGGMDRQVKLWNTLTGGLIRQMNGHNGAVYSAKLSANGQYVISGAAGNQLFLWNAQTGGIICAFWNHLGAVRAVDFTPDSEDVIAGDDGVNVIHWQLSGLILVRNYSNHKAEIDEVAVSPDGITVASASGDGMVKLWRGELLYRTINFGTPVYSIDFSPDNSMIAVGGGIMTKIYNVANGAELGTTFHGGVSMGVAFAKDSQSLYSTCTGGEVKRLLPNGTEQWLVHLDAPVLYIAVPQSGNNIAVATLHYNSNQVWTVIRILNATNGAEIRSWTAHADYVRGLTFTPSGKLIAVFFDGTMRAWDPNTGVLQWNRVGPGGVNDFALNSKGDVILTGEHEVVRFFRESNGAQIASFDRGFPFAVNAVALSADERKFVYGLDTGTFAVAWSPFFSPISAVTLGRGSTMSGGVSSLAERDSGYWKIKPGPVFSQSQSPIELTLSGEASANSASRLSIKVVAAASAAVIQQKVELFNFQSGGWESVDTRLLTTADQQIDIDVVSLAGRFVNSTTREVRARLSYRQTGPVISYPWNVRIDQAFWIANP
jgi:WD40 repeat protein